MRHSGGGEHFWPLSKDSGTFQIRKRMEQSYWGGLGLLLTPLLRRWQWVVEMGMCLVEMGMCLQGHPRRLSRPPCPRREGRAGTRAQHSDAPSRPLPGTSHSRPTGDRDQSPRFTDVETEVQRGQRAHITGQGTANSCPCSRAQLKDRCPSEAVPSPQHCWCPW